MKIIQVRPHIIIRFEAAPAQRELRSALFFRWLVADDTAVNQIAVLYAPAPGGIPQHFN